MASGELRPTRQRSRARGICLMSPRPRLRRCVVLAAPGLRRLFLVREGEAPRKSVLMMVLSRNREKTGSLLARRLERARWRWRIKHERVDLICRKPAHTCGALRGIMTSTILVWDFGGRPGVPEAPKRGVRKRPFSWHAIARPHSAPGDATAEEPPFSCGATAEESPFSCGVRFPTYRTKLIAPRAQEASGAKRAQRTGGRLSGKTGTRHRSDM